MSTVANQFDAGLLRESGVEGQYVNCVGNFVRNALARAVAAGKQFKVFKPVVVSNPVDVMDGFAGKKLPAKSLFHNVAMIHNVLSSVEGHAHVSVIGLARDGLNLLSKFDSLFFLKRLPTFATANVSLPHKASVLAAFNGNDCAADLAGRASVILRGFSTKAAALNRTIKGISAKGLPVASQFPRISFKRLPAKFAGKRDGLNFVGLSPVNSLVSSIANGAAIFSIGVFRFGKECVAALYTRQLDRHAKYPLVMLRDYQYHDTLRVASSTLAGAA